MKTATTTIALLLLAAVAGCENGGQTDPPAEYSVGREIIEALAAHVGKDPSEIRVREGVWKHLEDYGPPLPEVAESIKDYVEEAGISIPSWTERDVREAARRWREEGADPNTSTLVLMPRIPGVVHHFQGWGRNRIFIGYGGIRPGCGYEMPLEPLADGGWRIGELEKDCNGFSAAYPWRLENGKWVLDPQ